MFTTGKIAEMFTPNEVKELEEIRKTEDCKGFFVKVKARTKEEIEQFRHALAVREAA
jgi:hypothetical protein